MTQKPGTTAYIKILAEEMRRLIFAHAHNIKQTIAIIADETKARFKMRAHHATSNYHSDAYCKIIAEQMVWEETQKEEQQSLPEVSTLSMDGADRWGKLDGSVTGYTVMHRDPIGARDHVFVSQVYFNREKMLWCSLLSDLELAEDDIYCRIDFIADIDKFLDPESKPEPVRVMTASCDADTYSELMGKDYDDYPGT